MKKTKTICTIGPSTDSVESIRALLREGMNVARLNMSHGSLYLHQKTINKIKKARQEENVPCAIMVDTCGPEIRIGTFKGDKITLKRGDIFSFYLDDREGDVSGVSLPYPKLSKLVTPMHKIFASNGLLEFNIRHVDKKQIECEVEVGGELSNHKSLSIKGIDLPLPFISLKDEENLRFAVENDVEYISASFVNSKKDVLEMREFLDSINGNQKIIAKIESEKGIKNIDEIISVSDGIMVARGDLGTDIDIEKVPMVQRLLINKAMDKSKIVIVATEMLESMTHYHRPTRAETTDVSLAVYEKASATMLSGETSSGDYPIEACRTMSKIQKASEENIDYSIMPPLQSEDGLKTICYTACLEANILKAKAIVCYTYNGQTALMLSSFRPSVPIIAVTHDESTYNMLSLSWGVKPVLVKAVKKLDKMIEYSRELVVELGLAEEDDRIVLTLGLPALDRATTNTIHIFSV